MKETLLDLFTSKKFLAATTAIAVYLAGRFGFDLDTAALDRIYAAFLVYVGAQAVADHGKGAAEVREAAFASQANRIPSGLETGAAIVQRDQQAGRSRLTVLLVLAAVAIGSVVVFVGCTAAQRTDTKHAAIDCTAANGAAIGSVASSMKAPAAEGGCLTAAGTDWICVTSKAIKAGLAIGGCAFVAVLDAPTSTARLASAAGPAPPDRAGRAAFESYRASQAGGAAFRTAAGER